jgi:hypothetical protein
MQLLARPRRGTGRLQSGGDGIQRVKCLETPMLGIRVTDQILAHQRIDRRSVPQCCLSRTLQQDIVDAEGEIGPGLIP